MGKTVKSKKGRVSCEAENISQFKNIFQINKYERSNGRVCKRFKTYFVSSLKFLTIVGLWQ